MVNYSPEIQAAKENVYGKKLAAVFFDYDVATDTVVVGKTFAAGTAYDVISQELDNAGGCYALVDFTSAKGTNKVIFLYWFPSNISAEAINALGNTDAFGQLVSTPLLIQSTYDTEISHQYLSTLVDKQ